MKRTILTILAAASLALTAGAKKSPAPADTTTPDAVATTEKPVDAKKTDAIKMENARLFYGEIREVDKKRNTFTIAKHTYNLTGNTIITLGVDQKKSGTAADLKSGLIGGGKYVVKTMEALQLNLRTKEEVAAKRAANKEVKEDKKTDRPDDKSDKPVKKTDKPVKKTDKPDDKSDKQDDKPKKNN